MPVEELDDGEWGGIGGCRGNTVQPSLSDVYEVQPFTSLQGTKQTRTQRISQYILQDDGHSSTGYQRCNQIVDLTKLIATPRKIFKTTSKSISEMLQVALLKVLLYFSHLTTVL